MIRGLNFLLSLLLLIAINQRVVFCQGKDEVIKEIKDKVEDIHLDTNLKSVTLQNEEFLDNMTDGGGELTGFYKNDMIYKIYESVAISYGVYVTEFYFWKNQLIYVRDRFSKYILDSANSLDFSRTETAYLGHYYFDKGKLIRSDVKGKDRFENEAEAAYKFFPKESEKNIELIRKKIKHN